MQRLAPIPTPLCPIPSVPPGIRRFWICLPLLALGATVSASPPATPSARIDSDAVSVRVTDARSMHAMVGVGENHPESPPGTGKPWKSTMEAKAPYPRWNDNLWNTSGQVQAWQAQRKWHRPGAWPGNASWKGAQAEDWKAERRAWPQRGGYRGRMIGKTDFGRFYGAENPFRLWLRPKVKNGYPHFSHRGNTFRIVDPYPENWNPSWHRRNSLFVGYDRGYYLHNRKYPGFPIAVMVVR